MCSKSSLGIVLMKPSAIIAILVLKLNVDHKRNGSNIVEMIEMNEDHAHM